MGTLEGRVAVVTGAASGNGRGIALRFAEEGADVALADVDEGGLEQTATQVEALGRRALAGRCDVTKKADVEAIFHAAATELGPVTIAVANAGVCEEQTDILKLSEAEWDRTLGINLKGTFLTLQAAARHMVEQGRGGRLIAIASIMSRWGSSGTPAYSASKGGIQQLVRSFALACGSHGITCNGIGPGFIDTAMTTAIRDNPLMEGFLVDRTPVGRIGQPADVAHVAAFLAGDAAGFITGDVIYTDGGITAGMYSGAAARLTGDG